MTKKIVLVTGASSGIGKATTKLLAKQGLIVYGAARRLSEMGDLMKLGGHPIAMDVTDQASVESAIEKIMQAHGRIDVLVNNAGFGLYGSIEDVKLDQAKYQFEVNVFGLARVTQLVTPIMRKQKSGTVINMSSMGGRMYTPLGGWYHATKHAVEGLSDCLRVELKPFGIDVVIIEPGIIRTNFGNVLAAPLLELSKGGAYEGMVDKMMAGREAVENSGSSPDVIAQTISAAIHASSPKSRYLVGKLAKPLVYMRRWLGDRLFDSILMSQLK
ncbi:oxidoreductase [Undibacterium sp. RTI2.1]|uniref:oxidoreductase n=1 Tax=unclassified Undibacterium TaxID=2630295 RepID=UPI002B23DC4C|nr:MULTISPECIES: oxidoreductase [unclassified Undibacterium]MEB0032789.1 oxidoreductase [Undibacterium sp. RTI2.1]MEB0118528.1 oxidoreductase [Undibacterium sp. RTI2.2]